MQQRIMATQPEATEKRVPLADKRNPVHKRLDRWVRLQQFVYGLPDDDYAYAVCITRDRAGNYESKSLVRVGWMNWFGLGHGVDRHHALAVSLLETTEAVSTNSSAVLLHKLSRFFGFAFRYVIKKKNDVRLVKMEKGAQQELLAG